MSIRFRPFPKRGEVHSASPDGCYLMEIGDRKQVIIVGPMPFTPGDVQLEFDDFEIEEVSVMTPGSEIPEVQKIIMRRGFVMIMLRRYPPGPESPIKDNGD